MEYLKDIAEIFSGYAFRERVGAFPAGDTAVVQMKNIDSNDSLQLDDVPRVSIPDLNERHLLRPGDLLLRARGLFHTAAVVTQVIERAIAAAPLMVIRVKSPLVQPAYLRWFLNQQATQAELVKLAADSHVQNLNKVAIEGLEIPLPPLDRQSRIATLAELGMRERALAMMIAEKRAHMIERKLAQSALAVVPHDATSESRQP